MKKIYETPSTELVKMDDIDLLTASDPSDPYAEDIWKDTFKIQ